jgi:hypothetical protein
MTSSIGRTQHLGKRVTSRALWGRMEIWVDSTKQYTETTSTSLSAAIMARPGTQQFTVYAVNTEGTVWSQTVTATIQ